MSSLTAIIDGKSFTDTFIFASEIGTLVTGAYIALTPDWEQPIAIASTLNALLFSTIYNYEMIYKDHFKDRPKIMKETETPFAQPPPPFSFPAAVFDSTIISLTTTTVIHGTLGLIGYGIGRVLEKLL